MENRSIYQDIAKRTDGNIYIGVVGPVRSGKSTFIKKFMETLVIPNIEGDFARERAIDELPQSSAGKTIMTTEPKFIPEEAVHIKLDENASMNVRMIDCVGYILPSSIGYIENEQPRMVVTPWYDKEIPFNMAAEIGTQKVITDHSSIGLVITTDGSISDIPRGEYEEVEDRVINELKEIDKPFAVLLNCVNPRSESARETAAEMENKYGVPVVPTNCLDLTEADIRDILAKILYQFPVKEVCVDVPGWLVALDKDHWLKKDVFGSVQNAAKSISHISEIAPNFECLGDCENIQGHRIDDIDLGQGSVKLSVVIPSELLYKVLGEATGLEIEGESGLLPCLMELAAIKKEYDKIKGALEEVAATGYGIVMPGLDELTLEEPEIVHQGGRYGVKLRASAPSIHMMRADITTEVSPIVGSEKQSEELVMFLLDDFEENPEKIWSSNIFGKSLHELVNEGLHNKLYRMPSDARMKLQETIERIINEGCSGLVCIIL
ncbi:MAG: stage IV sporulation protein A [Oscillospiraceae bacterium]|jgi:stage IV sporulation protein A|nr:stage IV sporulation protein A [Oscillospiraceae bacterium]